MSFAFHRAVFGLRVAFIALSLGVLGRQALRADRLVRSRQGGPDVNTWLVAIDPVFPCGLGFAIRGNISAQL